MSNQIKRLNRELVHKGAILDIYKDTMELPNGNTETWDFVAHRKGAACVIPILPDGRVLMVRQLRPSIERETLEIPAGCRDSINEDTKITAARELEEETGYRSDNLELLLRIKSAPAFCNEHVDVYLARNLVKVGNQKLDDAEDINVEIYTIEELCEKVYAGEIQDSKTVAAIMAYSNKYVGR